MRQLLLVCISLINLFCRGLAQVWSISDVLPANYDPKKTPNPNGMKLNQKSYDKIDNLGKFQG